MKIAIKCVKKGKCFPNRPGKTVLSTLARADGRLSWWQKQTQPTLPSSERAGRKVIGWGGPGAPVSAVPPAQAALRRDPGLFLAGRGRGRRGDRAGQSRTSRGRAQGLGHPCQVEAESDLGRNFIPCGQMPHGSMQLPSAIWANSMAPGDFHSYYNICRNVLHHG